MDYFYYKHVNCPYCENRTYTLTRNKKERFITCTLCGNDLKVATKKDLKWIMRGNIYHTDKE